MRKTPEGTSLGTLPSSKCFCPGGPKIGISQILGPKFEISQYLDRRGKNIFELVRVPHEVPSRVSHTSSSLKLTKLCVHEVYLSLGLKNWSKSVNVEKSSIIVPPGENHFDPGSTHVFAQPPQIL